MSDPIDRASPEVAALWIRAHEALATGDLESAQSALDGAIEALEREVPVESELSTEICDRLVCAQAALVLELGGDFSKERLRAVLLRSRSAVNQYVAAYQLGHWFELQKEFKKGLFYSGIAVDQAALAGRKDLRAHSFNLRGNLLAAESRFEEALSSYQRALEIYRADEERNDEVWVARILDNVGYCQAVLGDPRLGLRSLYQSLRQLRRKRAERYQISTLLDLSFALAEVDRPELALQHAGRALELAEKYDDQGSIRNALFLKGDAAASLGLLFESRRAYDRLAQLSGHPELADFLVITDARALVNLKA